MTASANSSSSTTRTTKTRATSGRRKPIRLAPITARDVEVDEGAAAVRDPYDPSSFITATVNRRVDVLAAEQAAGRITAAQFLVGRDLQAMWEKQLGVRSGSIQAIGEADTVHDRIRAACVSYQRQSTRRTQMPMRTLV